MKNKLPLIIIICFLSINTITAQLYFGPSITHTSTREWDATSEEYTTNDFNFSLYYQFNSLTATKISVSNLVRQGDNRSTEFIRIPVMLEMTIEDIAINDQQLWRLYPGHLLYLRPSLAQSHLRLRRRCLALYRAILF